MDKKNLIAFLALSLAVLLLSNLLFPPLPQPKPQVGEKAPAVADAGAKAGGGEKLANAPDRPAESEANAEAEDEDAVQLPALAADEVPLQFVSLGSLDRETGFRMLVTLTNQGAAVKRAELASPRFLDLVDRSGYLGHLEFDDTPDGLEVQVVGLGTPAAQAGVRSGDVITSVQRAKGEPVAVKTVDEFEAVRTQTKPGQDFVLRVVRDGGASQQLTAKLTRRPLEVMRPEIDNILMRKGTIPEGFVDPPSFLASMTTLGGLPLKKTDAKRIAEWLERGHWQVTSHDQSSVTFERPIPAQKLKLIKRYTLEPVPPGSREDEDYPGYNLRLDVEVENTGDAKQTVAYRLDGPTGLPLEGWWYTHKISQRWLSGAGLRDVVVRFQGLPEQQIDCATIADDKDDPMGQGSSLAYVGVDAVYFSAVMIPVKASLDEDWFDSTEAIRIGPKPDPKINPTRFTNVSCRLTRKTVELDPGQSQKDSYVVFIGPKRPPLLAQYKAANDPNYSLKDIIYYGMWPFGAVARGMLGVLHFFYGIVGNYGIAIIMLTVLVRGAMFPVSFKQTKNMARMQALKPELDRINEKYKTDMQKRSAAMQEVYRKNKINPLGGCLPVVLQLPIFIGLYRSIMVDVELRDSPLFGHWIHWCSDLAAPDMLYNWSWFMPAMVNSGEGIFALGPYFNVLPIVTVVLFLVSMKFSMPEPTNEQGVMQQKMMKYMTGFMGLMFYKVASGLCLYFIASSLWGLGERRLLTKAKLDSGQTATNAAAPGPRDAAKRNSNGRNGSAGKKGSKEKRKR
ncbi:MAG: membrane protein insertase YidC [Pirellulales bacterium]